MARKAVYITYSYGFFDRILVLLIIKLKKADTETPYRQTKLTNCISYV